jgi:hypothetical protein
MSRVYGNKKIPINERFWKKVVVGPWCWLWVGPTYRNSGYGCLNVLGKMLLSHRMSWVMAFGSIPSGMCVLHRCDNRPCVNPSHLFLGTKSDNMKDMMAKGRYVRSGFPGELNPSAKLTASQVAEIRTRLASGETKAAQARRYGVCHSTISLISSGMTWRLQ